MEVNLDNDVLLSDLYVDSAGLDSYSFSPYTSSSISSLSIIVDDEDVSDLSFPGDVASERPYLLCNNTINYTHSSVFCNTSYILPNYGQNDYKENFELERIVSVVVPILFGIIFIVGLFGNALVVIVVASNQNMKNTTNLLILNLAIADLLFIIFCVPFTATDYVLNYWPFGETWCKMVQYLIIVTAYASVNTLVLMSFDRFLAVVFPVASISLRTDKNTLTTIAITWVIILLACLPAFLAHGLETQSYAYEFHEVCTFKREFNHVVFQLIFMSTSYAIPLTIICLLYFGMLFRLWTSVSAASNQALRGKKRVTRMIVVVVGVFVICWLPIQVVLVLKSLGLYEITDVTIAIQITAHVLGYMNSCVNPILYAFLSETFRKGFRKVIQCKICCGQVSGETGIAYGRGGSRIRSRTEGKGLGGGRGGGVGGGRTSIDGGAVGHLLGGGNGTTGKNANAKEKEALMMTSIDGHFLHLNTPVTTETALLTTHCENGGRNSHHLFHKGKNHVVGQAEYDESGIL